MVASRIVFGTWQIGGARWERVSNSAACALVRHGLDSGIRVFDTSNVYGNGRSQVLLGKALEGVPRDDFEIIVKIGYLTGIDGAQELYDELPQDFRPEALHIAVAESLARLGLGQVDYLMLHDAPSVVLQDDGVWDFLRSLQSAGIARSIGLSTIPKKVPLALERGAEAVQMPVFLGQQMVGLDAALEACAATDVPIFARSVLQGGRLLEGYDGESKENRVQQLLAHALDHPSVSAVLIGFQNAMEIDDVVEFFRTHDEVGPPA